MFSQLNLFIFLTMSLRFAVGKCNMLSSKTEDSIVPATALQYSTCACQVISESQLLMEMKKKKINFRQWCGVTKIDEVKKNCNNRHVEFIVSVRMMQIFATRDVTRLSTELSQTCLNMYNGDSSMNCFGPKVFTGL